MSFYTRLYDFFAGAVVRSQEFDDEFNAIQAGFSAVETRLTAAVQTPEDTSQTLPSTANRINKILSFDASGNVACTNSFTGSFSFSGTLSCADPVAGSDAATKQWTQTLALSTTIPVLPGDSGKVLTNNGTVLNWAIVDFATSTSGTVAVSRGGTGQTTASAGLNALLPSQTGKASNVLVSNGADANWAGLNALLPSQTGKANNFLVSNGTDANWADQPHTAYQLSMLAAGVI